MYSYAKAIEIEPNNESARLGRAVILNAMGRLQEAVDDADVALELNMGSGDGHYNKSLSLLSMGRYKEGFREHEWRFGTKAVLGPYRFKKPLWAGQKTDKRILIYCEQGLGDNLQFCRYLTQLKGLNVTLEAPKPLVRLLGQFGFPVVDRDAEEKPEFDLHCPMMSLGAVFGTTLNTIPSTDSYLKANGSKWRQRLSEKPGLKVGVSWSSGVRLSFVIAMTMQKKKSINTPAFAALMQDTPGVTFVSLQKEPPHDREVINLPNWYDPMVECNDLQDTAELIEALDLVITVDSAVAHLAGALGKPVWVLNRYDICWRWLSGEVESPWYNSAKIYRQHKPMDWGRVLEEVKHDLAGFAASQTSMVRLSA
jgi:tetratricopeptide (TPR) repeat protein